ncbi:NADPH:quinone reductase-like Zn-dependent oxidoreductase [Labrys monachus]|uniref:NADPH:quinone reductase-like Zn-dependent oxidoreductase n=1 Tax=Labrys monachus TaxID=217067 RepID=A0ABU0FNH7_9HYPH|nr:NADPH:quinone reductase-like Zn-dependent oxidoreductase [Labrys monachus]
MPEPRPGDLLVKVKAAGVNRADFLQRQGDYGRQSYGESGLLGLEVAGEVVAVGRDVTDVRSGERVMAIVGGGVYAEYARVDRGMAVRIPDDLDDVGAAAVMESFVTAWEAAVQAWAIIANEARPAQGRPDDGSVLRRRRVAHHLAQQKAQRDPFGGIEVDERLLADGARLGIHGIQ